MELKIDIHSDECEKSGCNCHDGKHFLTEPWEYTFNYIYEKRIANVYPCMRGYNGTPHQEILQKAVGKIKDSLGIEHSRHLYNISYRREDFIEYLQKDYDRGEIVEIVRMGTWGSSYHVSHNINDLDIKDISKRDISDNREMFGNVYHLLETKLGCYRAEQYSKKCRKVFDEIKKQNERDERIEKARLKKERKIQRESEKKERLAEENS